MCMELLNDFLLLQLLLLLLLLLINTNIELLFIIFNSIIYLFIIVCYSWLYDVDILINFLLIIDLGVFFILLAFIVNLVNLFTQILFNNQLSKNLLLIFSLLCLCLLIQYYFNLIINLSYTLYLQINWFFLLIYYNWFSIFNIIYFSDLQLLSEIYFFFNILEFLIMNIIIYITIFIIYLGIHNWHWFKTYIYYNQLHFLLHINQFQFQYFFKIQNMQNQILTRGSTRIWLKNNI
jgi:hypothetical protein